MRSNLLSIAVSGQCSTGKSTLCKVLSKRLNWKYVDIGGEFKNVARRHGLRIEDFGAIPEDKLRKIDKQMQRRMKTETNTVWDSRLSCYLARKNRGVFKVYCRAGFEIRVERTANRDSISMDEAAQKVLARDREEIAVFTRLYGILDPCNEKWIDLIIDTSNNSPEELADRVIKAIRAQ